jgi:hypothetical protein
MRFDGVVTVAIAVLALVPRTINLLGLDPFVDEAAALDWPLRLYELTSPRTWMFSLMLDGRPPLYFWTVVPFGVLIDNGFVAGRLAAVLVDVLCAAALYVLGRDLASRTVGIVAAVLWSLCALPIFFARLAVDDSMLTLMAVLSTIASVRFARNPTVRTGAICGLLLGLTVLTKTNGIFIAVAVPLAIVVLGRPFAWRQYLRPLTVLGVAGLLPLLPMVPGIAPLIRQAADHTGSGAQVAEGLFSRNALTMYGWMVTYVGVRFLVMVGLGIVLALLFRQAGMLFIALLGACVLGVILEVTGTMFSRRLLLPAFPTVLLVGYAIERVAWLARRGIVAAGFGGARVGLAASIVVAVLGIAVALSERADLVVAVVRDPAQAHIPGSEHNGYVENWFALSGLGRIVEELRARGQQRPVTVLVPPASRESRVMVPYSALRYYLRGDPAVRFVEAPALWRAQDLRELRRVIREGPTYLVVNGSYTPAAGMPNDVPAYTRQLERRLAQDIPEYSEVLRIPRPTAPNWLSLYRLDGGE